MSLQRLIREARDDERGFAIVIAVALMTLVTIVSLGLMTLASGENSHSRRDQAADNSYQAAEAGTNAYLSDLTEATGIAFTTAYMAKGEATRYDSGNTAHSNSCATLVNDVPTCADTAWSSGSTWTYQLSRSSDTGWYTLPSGYQYLIQVFPANTGLSGLAQVITRIDVTGRPCSFNAAGTACTGSTDTSTWKTIETQLRPSSLADFQAFLATSITYGATATTTGPIFVGEDSSGNPGNLTHQGTAKANLYAEGSVTVSAGTLTNGAQKYDSSTNPTALCKLNNCTKVPFSSFSSTFATVSGAASGGGITLAATDPTNAALSGQSYNVDAWKLVFQANGTVLVSSCKKYVNATPTTFSDYDGMTPPVCGTAVSKSVPTNGAIYSAVDVLVSGVVKGKVTVATAGNVIYGGNVTYNTNGVDVLGVEATGTIYIAPWALDSNGDITIWSAQFALNGPFVADPSCNGSSGNNWYTSSPTNCHASNTVCKQSPAPYGSPATCTMTINGSSAVYGQSGSAISMANMFQARNYNYDPNLLFVQPPYWPSLGNAFTILTQRPI
jgi:Tfp pilus assembly protein PilX